MAMTVKNRVQNYRNRMRAAGFRSIQLWVPDTRRKGFSAELKRQALLVVESDRSDQELMGFLDMSFDEIGGSW